MRRLIARRHIGRQQTEKEDAAVARTAVQDRYRLVSIGSGKPGSTRPGDSRHYQIEIKTT